MKHKRTKRSASAVQSAAWLFSALVVLFAIVSPLFVFTHPTQAAPLPPPGGAAGGPVITAHFIDSNHIGIVVGGTPTTETLKVSGGGTVTVDMAYLQGIYAATNDNISPFPTGQGSLSNGNALPQVPANETYTLNGSTGDTGNTACSGANISSIYLDGHSPQGGNIDVVVNGHIPSVAGTGSLPAGQCMGVELSNNAATADLPALSVNNPRNGGPGVQTFIYKDEPASTAHSLAVANIIQPNASAIMFYQASAGEIDAAAYDPTMGTADSKNNPPAYTFTQPVTGVDPDTNRQGTLYANQGGYYQDQCLDKIFVPATSKPDGNQMVQALYEQCDPNHTPTYYAAKNFPILVLGDTPENVFAGLVTSLGGSTTVNTAPGAGSSTAPDPTLQCTAADSLITSLVNFVMCPLINVAWNAAKWMDGWINEQMQVDVSATFDTSKCGGSTSCAAGAYYTAWNSFRIIATGILVIAGLIMVTSQAFGFEMLDAYTIRKVLPRILIATIGISLSWPLMRFVVGFFDTLGLSIQGILYAPFKNIAGGISNTTTIFGSLLLGAGILALGFASLTFVLTALLALFVGFVILILRQIVIIMLIIMAPVAIACYILPNTQKVWKLWYDNFLGLMLMYPIVEILIAAGHIFSALTQAGIH